MNYNVKLRCTGGAKGAQSVTYSTFVVDAKDEPDAVRLATMKARARYFGDNPQVRVVSVVPVPHVVLHRAAKRERVAS